VPIEGPCGKAVYGKEEARVVLNRTQPLEPRRLRRYYCDLCRGWHLSKSRREIARQRNRRRGKRYGRGGGQ